MIFKIIWGISTFIIICAFGLSYYTNQILIDHNAKLFNEVRKCKGEHHEQPNPM